jgi:hypothetical protein
MTNETRQRGRASRVPGHPTYSLSIRLTHAERRALAREARRRSVTLAAYVRAAIVNHAETG